MKKIIVTMMVLLSMSLIFFVGWQIRVYLEGNGQNVSNNIQNESKKKINCIELYEAFISGNQIVNIGSKYYTINDLAYEYDSTLDEIQYAFFDMNADETPELHIRTPRFYIIFTCREEQLMFWREESVYSTPLNNSAMLYMRSGGGPEHISYEYKIFDFFGNVIEQINFEKYDNNENGSWDENDYYLFSDVQVKKAKWEEMTEKYLSVSSDKIQWKNHEK